MANRNLIPFLVTMMLVTGVCNTILNKYQDMQCVRNCDSPDPQEWKTFEQPVIQTDLFEQGADVLGGEDGILDDDDDNTISGLIPDQERLNKPESEDDFRIPLRGWRILLLAAPSCCDITGTTLMNVGLLFVAASIYQMTRGALVLFVGLFSVIFLRRKLYLYQWSALVIVVLGVAVVGLSGALFSGDSSQVQNDSISTQTADVPDAVQSVLGVLLIAAAQIFTASQFVLEEWILENYAMDPIQVVGWEGIFGFSVTLILMVILHLTIGSTTAGQYGYFDMKEGWHEIVSNRAVTISSLAIMVSIGGFNFFGLSVTRSVSATSRSTIDTCRTLFIWVVSLGLGWESFKWLQVVGFVLLVYGTFLFNDIVRPPLKACLPSVNREGEVLLPEDPIEHI
ncbi:hypothetical protein N7495_005744 [Penicillium taxi]|uniref:uncharacterized protein n=1 Tax=Penicillium taxi TaxID=168475 RepID=UPI002544F60D|nr:uncharacterized protein N7495_005744 [Penicillium taxi]KAJ5894053.1 hypothetical protein N7495_005744 [Penicillium taxi]